MEDGLKFIFKYKIPEKIVEILKNFNIQEDQAYTYAFFIIIIGAAIIAYIAKKIWNFLKTH